MRRPVPLAGLLFLVVSLLFGACQGTGREGAVAFGAGVDDVGLLQEEALAAAGFMVEARGPLLWRELRPIAGVQRTSRRGLLGYAGAAYDLPLGRGLHVTPSFAIGAFRRGTGKEVSSTHQFRSAVELAYERGNGHRIGVVLQHVSNAGLEHPNPGTESIFLTYSIPLR